MLAVALATGLTSDRMTAAGSPGDRTISFYNIHTKETLTVTYKRGGKYVPSALKQINWIMRDWRKNETIAIDPQTIDLAWEMYQELGSQKPIHIICGYRSNSTNQMLRRTRGGQANQSQHITGKAIDITFPDVPLKKMRYSALIRERGGVGYYPTSGIPFVHIDTARVRAWPRLPRQELALVFPSGHTKHMPASGGPITPADVKMARAKYHELAVQIAQFHDERRAPHARPTLVAAAAPAEPPPQRRFAVASLGPTPVPSAPKQETARKLNLTTEKLERAPKPFAPARQQQARAENMRLAALTPPSAEFAAPKLVAEPRLIERPSRFTPNPSHAESDRGKLDALVAEAAAMPMPKLVADPKPAARPQKALVAAATAEQPPAPARKPAQVASLGPQGVPASVTDMSPDALGTGWVQAPEFDEDHPEELAYRPFPLGPLLTDTPSAHDPQLSGLQHPDVAATLDMLDDEGGVPPMRFRPGQQLAEVMWAQQFQGKAVHLDALKEIEQSRAPTGMENRAVRTSLR